MIRDTSRTGSTHSSQCHPAPVPDAARHRPLRPGSAPRSLWRRRLARWSLGMLLLGGLLAAGFIPYPYQTGGPFKLLPATRLDVRSEIEGLVEKVMVGEGEWVEAGQPIATLVRRNVERNLKATEAQLQEKQATLRLLQAGSRPEEIDKAEKELETARASVAFSKPRADRYARLFADRMVSEQEYENALRQKDTDEHRLAEAEAQVRLVRSGARREEIEAARAEIDSLRALVENFRTDVERTVLTSPIAGRVVTPHVQEMAGAYVKPGQRDLIAQVEDARVLQAEVEIPEEDAASIRLGASVKVVPWSFHDRVFHGTVASVAPVATTTSSTQYDATFSGQAVSAGRMAVTGEGYKVVRVITEIPNAEGLLKSEMTGYAKIAADTRPVWDVLLRPLIRWVRVEVWYWIP